MAAEEVKPLPTFSEVNHLPAHRAPIVLSPALLPEIPFPTKIRTAFQEPIELDGDPERAQDDRYVEHMYDRVQTSIQHGMDALARRRRFPLFG